MVWHKPTHAVMRTICPDCGNEFGVTKDTFNRTQRDASHWRITVHTNWATGRRCTGARMIVSDAVVWDAIKLKQQA